MERIVNGKTLSLRHFLNTKLKGKVIDRKGHYALYTRIVYDKKSNRFKSTLSLLGEGETIYIPAELEYKLETQENYLDPKIAKKLNQVDEEILDLVSWEILKHGEKFSFGSFLYRISTYLNSIKYFFDLYAEDEYLEWLRDILTYNQYHDLISVIESDFENEEISSVKRYVEETKHILSKNNSRLEIPSKTKLKIDIVDAILSEPKLKDCTLLSLLKGESETVNLLSSSLSKHPNKKVNIEFVMSQLKDWQDEIFF